MSIQKEIWGGAMSGTSADGVDVAFVEASPFRLLHHSAHPYPRAVREKIMAARVPGARFTLADVAELGDNIAEEHARAISAAAAAAGLSLRGGGPGPTVAGVGVHGQTLYHAPPRTMQLINGPLLAALLNCPIICDFRRADCAAGGQGAPLVPYADVALFRDPSVPRVLLNLGGIANITTLPAGEPGRVDAGVLAFDTGPANCIADALCSNWLKDCRGVHDATAAASGPLAAASAEAAVCGYDDGGRLAAQGTVHAGVLAAALADTGYDAAAQAKAAAPPKATVASGSAVSCGAGAHITGSDSDGGAAAAAASPRNGCSYFAAPPPKSTDTPAMLQLWGRAAAAALPAPPPAASSPGAAAVGAEAASEAHHPCCAAANAGLSLPDALATACAITAVSAAAGIVSGIAESRRRLAASRAGSAADATSGSAAAAPASEAGSAAGHDIPWQVIVSGGGAANATLMHFLQVLLVGRSTPPEAVAVGGCTSAAAASNVSGPALPACAFHFVAAAGGVAARAVLSALGSLPAAAGAAAAAGVAAAAPARDLVRIAAVEPSSLAVGMPEGAKEAAAFALLAAACAAGKPNNVPACTGAARPVVGGVMVPRPFPEGEPGVLKHADE